MIFIKRHLISLNNYYRLQCIKILYHINKTKYNKIYFEEHKPDRLADYIKKLVSEH